MKKLLIFLLLIFIVFGSDSSKVKYHFFSPDELTQHYKTESISNIYNINFTFFLFLELEINLADFGYIPYGQSLIGKLHFANPRNACSPLNSISTDESDANPIVVVDRGGCHFVTKSHYAQLYGAKMVIILDNQVEQEDEVLMIDDGYGLC